MKWNQKNRRQIPRRMNRNRLQLLAFNRKLSGGWKRDHRNIDGNFMLLIACIFLHTLNQSTDATTKYFFRAFLVETVKRGTTEHFGLWWNRLVVFLMCMTITEGINSWH
jgi:hypothetical protein